MAKVRISFEHDAEVSYAPDFVDKCIRIVSSLDEHVGPFSVRFWMKTSWSSFSTSLSASIAWRNEVFAFFHCPLDEASQEAGIVTVSDSQRAVRSGMNYNETQAARELPELLLIHLKSILKKHELDFLLWCRFLFS